MSDAKWTRLTYKDFSESVRRGTADKALRHALKKVRRMRSPLQQEDEDTLHAFEALLSSAVATRNPRAAWTALCQSIRISGYIFSAMRTKRGMSKGRQSALRMTRRERTPEELQEIRRFVLDLRGRFPALGINAMIRETIKQCKVSKSFVDKHRRDGSLVIPPPTR